LQKQEIKYNALNTNDNNFAKLLAVWRNKLGYSQPELAAMLKRRGFKVSGRTLSLWENGAEIPETRLSALKEIMIEVDQEKATLRVEEKFSTYNKGEGKVVRFTESGTQNLPVRKVPFIDFRNTPNNMPLSNLLKQDHPFQILTDDQRAQFAFRMEGNSMAPRIKDGDVLFAEIVSDQSDLDPTAFYLVITASLRRVRQVQPAGDDLKLVCVDRENYPDVIIERGKVQEMAIIISRKESLLP
jgi:DNA-binding transcriptional regulator YiaG